MSGPWEKYAAPSAMPWEKYAAPDATSTDIPGTIPYIDPNRTHQQVSPKDIGANSRAGATPTQSDGWLGKALGVAEVPLSLATGIVGGLAGAVRGSPLAIPFSNAKDAKALEQEGGDLADSMTYVPRTQTGQNLVEMAGKVLSPLSALPIGPEMMAATRLAAPAMRQAAASPIVQATATTAKNAIAPEVFMAKSAAKKIASMSMLPKVSQETAQLADKAQQFGMKLTPDMLSKNKFGRIAGETMAKVPLSGAQTEANQAAFNRSLIKMIGGDETAHALTPDVYGDALTKAGETIGDVSSRTHIPLDDSFASSLARHVEDVTKFHTEDNARVIGNYVQELENKAAQNGGVIDGTAFRTLNTAIGKRVRGSSDGDLKSALGGLQENMMDALQKNITNPDDMTALLDARKKYAIAKTIEPLVAKSPTGDISAAGLMSRVTANGSGKTMMATGGSGDLGDLARVGQRFLKEPGSSNTAERGLAYGLMGGGAVTHLPTAAGVYTAANLYNRLSPMLTNRIVQKSLPARVPPVRFANEMSLMDESPFKAAPVAQPEVPYRGLLTLADDGDIASRAPASDSQRLATRHDHPTVEFPLRQEVLQQPEIAGAINDFRTEAARLGKIKDNAINPAVAAKAATDLAKLESEFAAGMSQLGISNAADAHGLNRPLYEAGGSTRLPIKTTQRNVIPLDMLPRAQVQAADAGIATGAGRNPNALQGTANKLSLVALDNNPASGTTRPTPRGTATEMQTGTPPELTGLLGEASNLDGLLADQSKIDAAIAARGRVIPGKSGAKARGLLDSPAHRSDQLPKNGRKEWRK